MRQRMIAYYLKMTDIELDWYVDGQQGKGKVEREWAGEVDEADKD